MGRTRHGPVGLAMHAGTDGGRETRCAHSEQLRVREEHAVMGRAQTHDAEQSGGSQVIGTSRGTQILVTDGRGQA